MLNVGKNDLLVEMAALVDMTAFVQRTARRVMKVLDVECSFRRTTYSC
jgi:hypothetical protein